MITHLAFYDMDGTLMDTPLPEEGKLHWKEKTGENYPHLGWWSRAESLDTKVFDIKPFPAVLSQLKNDTARPDTRTVLLTNRIEKLRPAVMNLLITNGISFDEYSLKNGGEEKDNRIERYFHRYPDVTEITFFDDREKEIDIVSTLKNRIGDDVTISIYQVIDGNITLVESYNKLKSIIVDEISKFVFEGKNEKGLSKPKSLRDKSNKIDGVSMGKDKDGYYIYTYRARSKSYASPEKISVKDIEFIESTG